jgi:hypothetical protein
MTPEARAQQAMEYPLVQAALQALDPGLHAALMQAVSSAIREAAQAERQACAQIALDAAHAAATVQDHAGEAMAAAIATTIRSRPTA